MIVVILLLLLMTIIAILVITIRANSKTIRTCRIMVES